MHPGFICLLIYCPSQQSEHLNCQDAGVSTYWWVGCQWSSWVRIFLPTWLVLLMSYKNSEMLLPWVLIWTNFKSASLPWGNPLNWTASGHNGATLVMSTMCIFFHGANSICLWLNWIWGAPLQLYPWIPDQPVSFCSCKTKITTCPCTIWLRLLQLKNK